MTLPSSAPDGSPEHVSAAPRTERAAKTSRLGLASVIAAGAAILPILVIVLIALFPGMDTVLWFLVVVLPISGLLGVLALVLGLVGLVMAKRAGLSQILPIVGTIAGALCTIGPLSLLTGFWM